MSAQSAEEQSEMASLYAAKQQLRSAMKKRLVALAPDSALSQSSVVFNTLKSFPAYVEANRISVFLSMPQAEVQTDAIVRHALQTGKEVFVPYLHRSPLPPSPELPARVMDMVRLKNLEDYESLKRDTWGIPSIDAGTVHERHRILGGPDAHHSGQAVLDLILMPGVAFDISPETGAVRRLGHGKGFYDYFIRRHNAKEVSQTRGRPMLLYGLALSEQFLSSPSEGEVPVGPLDQGLDGIILGDGSIKTPSSK